MGLPCCKPLRYWRAGQPLTVDFAPDHDVLALFLLPRAPRCARHIARLCAPCFLNASPSPLATSAEPNGWSNPALAAAERRLHRWEFHPVGTEGFDKAEVTAGGIDTADLEPAPSKPRAMPDLFFIGEAVDVTGHLGGFNFQWAWASAVAAGRVL